MLVGEKDARRTYVHHFQRVGLLRPFRTFLESIVTGVVGVDALHGTYVVRRRSSASRRARCWWSSTRRWCWCAAVRLHLKRKRLATARDEFVAVLEVT